MSIAFSDQPATAAADPTVVWPRRRTLAWWLARAALVILLVVNVPLFLRMPLETDATLYDLCARSLLRGGMEYRDVFNQGMPGMTWLHAAVRTLFGWSWVAIRAVDLLIVAGIIIVLVRWLRLLQRPWTACFWAALALAAFYLFTPEGNHVQRDIWMLLPAVIAMSLRGRTLIRLTESGERPAKLIQESAVEGFCWALAFWIKPFVAVPALCCWGVGAAWTLRARPQARRLVLEDAAGVLLGGIVAGAIGIGWLVFSGAWPYFIDIMRNWNPEYYRFARSIGWTPARLATKFQVFFPWLMVHVLAVPLAIYMIARALAEPRGPGAERRGLQALLAGLYLGWLAQSIWPQNLLEYIMVPPILLGLAVVASVEPPLRDRFLRRITGANLGWAWLPRRRLDARGIRADRRAWLCVFAGFAAMAAGHHPTFFPQRLMLWPRCWHEPTNGELLDSLSLTDSTDWKDLYKVRDFLRRHGAASGTVTTYGLGTQVLCLQLNLEPTSRWVYVDQMLACFIRHRQQILQDVMSSRQRFIVTDLRAVGFTRDRAADAQLLGPRDLHLVMPDELRTQFPWSEPVVLRAGLYSVHEIRPPAALVRAADHGPISDRLLP